MAKKIISSVIVFVFCVSALFAAQLNAQEKREIFKDLHKKVHEYSVENIFPQMLIWKEKLDASMEEDDLALLNGLREKAAEMKKEMRDKIKSHIRDRKKDCDPGNKDKMKKNFRHKKSLMKELAGELKPLAEKYADVLKAIAEDAKPYSEKWKSDIKDIAAAWKEEHSSELEEMKHFPRMKKHFNKLFLTGLDGRRKTAMFMLWNGEIPEFPEEDDSQIINSIDNGEMKSSEPKVYPNPFTENATIKFYLDNGLDVSLKIYDQSGNVVTTLHDGFLGKGEHAFEFGKKTAGNTALASGKYYYQLKVGSEIKSGTLLLIK